MMSANDAKHSQFKRLFQQKKSEIWDYLLGNQARYWNQ